MSPRRKLKRLAPDEGLHQGLWKGLTREVSDPVHNYLVGHLGGHAWPPPAPRHTLLRVASLSGTSGGWGLFHHGRVFPPPPPPPPSGGRSLGSPDGK